MSASVPLRQEFLRTEANFTLEGAHYPLLKCLKKFAPFLPLDSHQPTR
jgi:hypothetical protein